MEQLPAKQGTQSTELQRFLPKEELMLTSTFKNLTPTEKEIGLALYAPKLKDYPFKDLTAEVARIIGKTYVNSGQKFDQSAKDQLSATLDELVSDLQKYNSTMTVPEIELAFKNGWKGEYGEYFGLNNKTYFQWVNAYCWTEKRLRVKKTLLEAKEKEGKEPDKLTPEQQDMVLKEACLKSFDDYRKGIPLTNFESAKYNYLNRIGVLCFTEERKMAIQKEVKEKLRQEAIDEKQKTDTIEKALSRILDTTIVSRSKTACLKAFFQDLTETETELSDLLS